MKALHDEGIKNPSRTATLPDIDSCFWKEASVAALKKIADNLALYTDGLYPAPSSVKLRYPCIANVEWTSGFWPGLLWLSWELSGDRQFRDTALATLPDFRKRLDDRVAIDTHDLGFLYTLSCVAAYRLCGDEGARQTALKAATLLMGRYYEKAGIIQAWGDLNDPDQRGRIIIDCAMNLPLLFWASEQTDSAYFRDAARRHLVSANQYLLREDGSSYHTYYFDIKNGRPLRGNTVQGSSDSSCWARGQAWGIYGLALAFRYLYDPDLLELSSGLADYFLNRLPDDWVCYWDLSFTDGEEERDSSAAAIAACGLLELSSHLPLADMRKRQFENAAAHIAASLVSSYTARETDGSNGLLLHAVYNKPQRNGIDECCIWGDYFYLELLTRLQLPWQPYW